MRLPRRALTYLNLRAVITWAGTLLAGLVVHLVVPQVIPAWLLAWAAVIATASLIVDVGFVHRWRWRTYRYDLTSDATEIAHGRVFLRERSIPTRRAFGVEVVQGPLLRALGLVELRIVTVVGTHPLGPVPPDEAERIRTVITGAVEKGLHG